MLLDKKFRIQKRHCLMIIDNCSSHPNPLPVELTNLTINFLPKNTTSHTQPYDAGIIRELKSINARIMISNRSFITCLLFCHYWESMKRLQRISAISAKYSGSREIRSSEVLLYCNPMVTQYIEVLQSYGNLHYIEAL